MFLVLYSELSTEQTLSFSEASLQEVHSCDTSTQLGGIIQLCEQISSQIAGLASGKTLATSKRARLLGVCDI